METFGYVLKLSEEEVGVCTHFEYAYLHATNSAHKKGDHKFPFGQLGEMIGGGRLPEPKMPGNHRAKVACAMRPTSARGEANLL